MLIDNNSDFLISSSEKAIAMRAFYISDFVGNFDFLTNLQEFNFNAVVLEVKSEKKLEKILPVFVNNVRNYNLEIYLVLETSLKKAQSYYFLFNKLDISGIIFRYESKKQKTIVKLLENFRLVVEYELYAGVWIKDNNDLNQGLIQLIDFAISDSNQAEQAAQTFIYYYFSDLQNIGDTIEKSVFPEVGLPHEKDLDFLLINIRRALSLILKKCIIEKDDKFLKSFINELFQSIHASYGNYKKIIRILSSIHHEKLLINQEARNYIDYYINILEIKAKNKYRIELNKKK